MHARSLLQLLTPMRVWFVNDFLHCVWDHMHDSDKNTEITPSHTNNKGGRERERERACKCSQHESWWWCPCYLLLCSLDTSTTAHDRLGQSKLSSPFLIAQPRNQLKKDAVLFLVCYLFVFWRYGQQESCNSIPTTHPWPAVVYRWRSPTKIGLWDA